MPVIHLTTFIEAPAERVFRLSCSVALHKKSMENFSEEIVGGVLSGLVTLDDTVTWKARHLGKKRILKTRITAMDPPHSFTDEMVEGDFKSMKHQHFFKEADNGTIVIDLFEYELPYGFAGKLLDKFYLYGYLRGLLEQRNRVIREYAESSKWQPLLM